MALRDAYSLGQVSISTVSLFDGDPQALLFFEKLESQVPGYPEGRRDSLWVWAYALQP
jgi:hypothetical protein